jgi:hypothetical protein
VMFFSLSSAMVMFTCGKAGWSGGKSERRLCSRENQAGFVRAVCAVSA